MTCPAICILISFGDFKCLKLKHIKYKYIKVVLMELRKVHIMTPSSYMLNLTAKAKQILFFRPMHDDQHLDAIGIVISN